jgi:alpha-D-xyloside xylohydrolase
VRGLEQKNYQITIIIMIRHLISQIAIVLTTCFNAESQVPTTVIEVSPGVFSISAGSHDNFTPYSFCTDAPRVAAMKELPAPVFPFSPETVKIRINYRGCVVVIPLGSDEQLYGFGLQSNTFMQAGLKRRPIVNAYPVNDLGFSHAPVPMYVSNKGYAVLVNSARYTTFYCGTHRENIRKAVPEGAKSVRVAESPDDLYANNDDLHTSVIVDVPTSRGVEVFVFYGPEMIHAIRRYNLFSGGGALPAIWGLGIKYRVKADSKQEDVYRTAEYFRKNNIPCDVLGLEPRWQTRAYSCSFVWNKTVFS